MNAAHTPAPWVGERCNPSGGILIEAGAKFGDIIGRRQDRAGQSRAFLALHGRQHALAGRGHRRTLDDLLRETPDLALLIDTFEQPVQRHKKRGEADRYYSGKKKMHTIKTQVAVDERDQRIVGCPLGRVPPSEPGPTADITVLRRSGVLDRVPEGIGVLGDLAYVGMTEGYPDVQGAWPRRKPRGAPRPVEDVAYNTAFARRRVPVEHAIGRMRHFQAVTQRDRHHRRGMTARHRAVAGLVNRTNWRLAT